MAPPTRSNQDLVTAGSPAGAPSLRPLYSPLLCSRLQRSALAAQRRCQTLFMRTWPRHRRSPAETAQAAANPPMMPQGAPCSHLGTGPLRSHSPGQIRPTGTRCSSTCCHCRVCPLALCRRGVSRSLLPPRMHQCQAHPRPWLLSPLLAVWPPMFQCRAWRWGHPPPAPAWPGPQGYSAGGLRAPTDNYGLNAGLVHVSASHSSPGDGDSTDSECDDTLHSAGYLNVYAARTLSHDARAAAMEGTTSASPAPAPDFAYVAAGDDGASSSSDSIGFGDDGTARPPGRSSSPQLLPASMI